MTRRSILCSALGLLGLSRFAPAATPTVRFTGFDPGFGESATKIMWYTMSKDGKCLYAYSAYPPEDLSPEELAKAMANAEVLHQKAASLTSFYAEHARRSGGAWEGVKP
jgi:hypothetical protein